MINLKILIATHKKTILPENSIFIPIHVGSEKSSQIIDIVRDDSGINISDKNSQYCELTAIYWAYKNLTDFDYIGLFHYRRYLTFDRVPPITRISNVSKYIVTKFIRNIFFYHHNYTLWFKTRSNTLKNIDNDDYSKKLSLIAEKYDIITSKPIFLSSLSIRSFWSLAISNKVLERLDSIIIDYYPEYLKSYNKILKGNTIHPANIFIFEKILFVEYSQFLFNILYMLEDSLHKDNIVPLPRTMGYVGEILTSLFISYKRKKGIKVITLNTLEIS